MADPPTRKIIHVDMDAFFASVEQRDDPALRGIPVAVGHAGGRGVVVAASYEARVFGVRSAMPSSTARRLCPHLTFVGTRFEVYRAASQAIRAIFADYTDLIEPLSLDEAYLDVTANRRGLPSAQATAEEIRARIFVETGLTASAGVSYNKLLAKLGSGQNKPNGQCLIAPSHGADFVAALPVARFHGIGPATAAKMNRMGILTGADLRAYPRDALTARFGKAGGWYWSIARAIDERPVRADRTRKSSGSETTYATDLTDPADIEAGVRRQAAKVWAWCDRAQAFGRTVTVKIKYSDFTIATRSRTLAARVVDDEALGEVAVALVRSVYPLSRGIRLLGVSVSGFCEDFRQAPVQQMTFDLAS